MPAADALAQRAMAVIDLADYAKPMGALTLRFSGKRLAHVGKSVDSVLDRILAISASADQQVTFRGYLPKGKKRTRYAAPKRMEGAGRKLLATAFATMRAMPRDSAMIYLKDGPGDSLVPDRFAAYISLAADAGNTFATGDGFAMVAFPLATLEDPRWLALGDELVTALGAEVAWLGPAIWMAPHNLFNGSLNNLDSDETLISLFGTDPQLDVPSYFASRWPFTYDEQRPGPLRGFLTPSWVMWADRTLASKVKSFRGRTAKLRGATRYHVSARSPFAMTEAAYTEWKQAWTDLAPLHLTLDEQNEISQYYLTRFGAASISELVAGWRTARAAGRPRRKRSSAIGAQIQTLAKGPGGKLLAYAGSVVKQLDGDNLWYLLPALQELVVKDELSTADAAVWLDICDELGQTSILVKAAALAAAARADDRALDLLRRARASGALSGVSLKSDARFRRLRKDPRFAKVTGA